MAVLAIIRQYQISQMTWKSAILDECSNTMLQWTKMMMYYCCIITPSPLPPPIMHWHYHKVRILIHLHKKNRFCNQSTFNNVQLSFFPRLSPVYIYFPFSFFFFDNPSLPISKIIPIALLFLFLLLFFLFSSPPFFKHTHTQEVISSNR